MKIGLMSGREFKVYALWGILLFIISVVSVNIIGETNGVLLIILTISSLFTGYMAARALKNYKNIRFSSLYNGGIIPVYSAILITIFLYFVKGKFDFELPILQIIAGIIGGYFASKRS